MTAVTTDYRLDYEALLAAATFPFETASPDEVSELEQKALLVLCEGAADHYNVPSAWRARFVRDLGERLLDQLARRATPSP
jgi:hypothetical protein